jgi:hypothetical protein
VGVDVAVAGGAAVDVAAGGELDGSSPPPQALTANKTVMASALVERLKTRAIAAD